MAKIGVLVMTNKVAERGTRKDRFYDSFEWLGMKLIEKEIDREKHQIDYISHSQIDNYDFVLVSCTSIFDVMNLVYEIPKKRKAKIVIGGQGVVNVKSYVDFFDVAVFGRAEGQINEILEGKKLSNVLRISDDPQVENQYEYRQPQYLLEGENGIGCSHKCLFCQYSWTHRSLEKTNSFNSAIGKRKAEDDFRHLEIKDNRYYVSAIDGVSEKSRLKVGKGIKNDDIIRKFKGIYSKKFTKRISLKLFVICGFPWEKKIIGYLDELREIFSECDEKNSKFSIYCHLLFTPFSPEPLTPMEMEKPNLDVDWRKELLKDHILYQSDTLKVWVMQYINSPYKLFERVFLNRASLEDGKTLTGILINTKFRKLKSWQKMRWIKDNIDTERFVFSQKKEWDYLTVEHG